MSMFRDCRRAPWPCLFLNDLLDLWLFVADTVADNVDVADVAVGAVAFAVSIILLFREFGAPYLFLNALLHPSIRWRSQEFRLHWGGKAEVEVVDDKKKKKMFSNQEVQAIKLVSNSGKLGEFMSSRSIS